MEYLSRMMNLNLKISEPEKIPPYFIDGRCAEISLNSEDKKISSGMGERGKIIGFLGEIHPRVLKNWRIKMPVALMEINLEEIFKKLS